MGCPTSCYAVLDDVSIAYPPDTGRLLTRYAPLRRSPPKYCYLALPLDLHVLSLPLAFILSQDQTLHCIIFIITLKSDPATYNSLTKKSTLCSSDFNRVKIGTCLYLFFPLLSMNLPFFPKRAAKVCEFFGFAKIFSKNLKFVLPYACSTMSIQLASRTGLQR